MLASCAIPIEAGVETSHLTPEASRRRRAASIRLHAIDWDRTGLRNHLANAATPSANADADDIASSHEFVSMIRDETVVWGRLGCQIRCPRSIDSRRHASLAVASFKSTNAMPTPAPEQARSCPNATICASFWEACHASSERAVVAAVGVVIQVFATPRGGITVTLDGQAGSVRERRIVIKNIDPAVFEESRELIVGDEVAAGLVADERGSGH